MSFLSLISIEFHKIRRSKILLILLTAAVFLWLPAIFHGDVSFKTQADFGILPENNFMIQGFLGMSWFMFPAAMVVCTVLLQQTERNNHGILKMLALPVSTVGLCLAKFVVLLCLAALQIALTVGMYYISAAIVSHTQNYPFVLPLPFVLREACLIFLYSIPMLTFFWLVSVCIQTPIFSIGIELASIVPSVLIINTKLWFAYPMAYPLFAVSNEYGRLASAMTPSDVDFTPLLIVALSSSVLCLFLSCLRFGKYERR